jgi:hypothetical protein
LFMRLGGLGRIPLDVDTLDGAKAVLEKIRTRNPERKPSFGGTPPPVQRVFGRVSCRPDSWPEEESTHARERVILEY